jgi:hypothetical protein
VDIILTELKDRGLSVREKLFDILRGTIAMADPNDLGRKSENETSLMKIGILGYDNKIVVTRKFPYYGVICIPQAEQPHMR